MQCELHRGAGFCLASVLADTLHAMFSYITVLYTCKTGMQTLTFYSLLALCVGFVLC
jgi:hypothetical protein